MRFSRWRIRCGALRSRRRGLLFWWLSSVISWHDIHHLVSHAIKGILLVVQRFHSPCRLSLKCS